MFNLLAAIGVVAVSVPFIFGLVIASVAWKSWWLYPAWGWFLVPLGLPAITFWHFAALLLFVDTLRHIDTKKDDRKTEWGSVVINFLWPMAVWVILRWMR